MNNLYFRVEFIVSQFIKIIERRAWSVGRYVKYLTLDALPL